MSRIAKNVIKINDEISCNFEDGVFVAKGKLGEMRLSIKPTFKISINDSGV